jgi:hypothetical protein
VAVPLDELATLTYEMTRGAHFRVDAEAVVWLEIDPVTELDSACGAWLELVEARASDAGLRYEAFVETSSLPSPVR